MAAAAAPKAGSAFRGATQVLYGLMTGFENERVASRVQTQSGIRTFTYEQVKERVSNALAHIDRATEEERGPFLSALSKAAAKFQDLVPAGYAKPQEAKAGPAEAPKPAGRQGALPFAHTADLEADIVNRISRLRPPVLD